jgi:hypothetical protein
MPLLQAGVPSYYSYCREYVKTIFIPRQIAGEKRAFLARSLAGRVWAGL